MVGELMSKISDRVIEEVRYRSDIVDVVSAQVHLKKAGATWKACCPFHKEKTPSFTVNPERQSYKCFGCGEGGDVFSFVMKTQGLQFLEAVRFLAQRCGVEIVEERETGEQAESRKLRDIHAQVASLYQRLLRDSDEAAGAREYLRSRGLEGRAQKEFQIGYAPEGWDTLVQWAETNGESLDLLVRGGLLRYKREKERYYDAFRGRLMFPIRDMQGRVVAFSARKLLEDDPLGKYVNSPETPIFKKSRILYGFDLARKHIVSHPNREAVVCEGQIDVIRCHVSGVPRAVAAQGTAFTEEHAEMLKRYADSAVLVFDSDPAGKKAAIKTAGLFIAQGMTVRVACLPEGEDPDSFVAAKGHRAFEELLEHAGSAVAYAIKAAMAEEDDPGSVGAIDRTSREVLALIAPCPNAVQSAAMLREAALVLELPLEALQREMDGVQEKERVRRSYADSRSREREDARQAHAWSHAHEGVPDAGGWDPAVHAEPVFDEMGDVDFGMGEVPQGHGAAIPAPAAPSRDEWILCEHLVHVEDDPEIGHMVGTFLPEEMLESKMARAIRAASLVAADQGRDLFEVLAEDGDAELGGQAMQLFKAPVRVRGEFSHTEAVRDLILRLWRQRLQREREQLRGRAGELSAAEQRRVWQLTIDLKQLVRWDTGAHVIEAELG
jgi:DNA primase